VRRPRKPDAAAAEADERTVRTAALALLAGRDFAREELAKRLARRGLKVALYEEYKPGQKDYANLVTKMRDADIAVAYVGEDGIEPNVAYRVDNKGKWVRA